MALLSDALAYMTNVKEAAVMDANFSQQLFRPEHVMVRGWVGHV